jgi:hypothetical protein
MDDAWHDFGRSIAVTSFALSLPAGDATAACVLTGPYCPACLAAVITFTEIAILPAEVAVVLGEINELITKIKECHKKYDNSKKDPCCR